MPTQRRSPAVLHCITGLDIGGAERMLVKLLQTGCAGEANVLSLLTPGTLGMDVARAGVPIRSLNMRAGEVKLRDAIRLRRSLRQTPADVVHGWMYHGMMAATVGTLGWDRRVVWGIHHSLNAVEYEKPLTRRLLSIAAWISSRPAAITYTSRVSAEQHERLGFDRSKRVVIPNGIDCDEFLPVPGAGAALRARFRIPAGRLIVGHVSRYHPMKDQESFVRALAELVGSGMDVQGLVIGPGHENEVMRKAALKAGIAERLTMLPAQTDLRSIVPAFDVHAITSAWGETFSLATAEAMACGVPGVVTDLGDCAWVVGDTGLTVPTRDASATAAALRHLLELAPASRRELGARARQRILDHFSIEQYVARHIDLYESVAALPAGGGRQTTGPGSVGVTARTRESL